MKRFLVTGCPRSGTTFTTAVFKRLLVRCGHEDVFGVDQGLGEQPVDWNGWAAESSWMAVPFLPLDDDVVILHQVRHPLEVIRSMVGIRHMLREPPSKFGEVVRRHAPEVFEPEDKAERAAVFWRIWNTRVQDHATFTYRLEDFGVDLLVRLFELVELDRSEKQAAGALQRTPKNVNQRRRAENITWDRIAPILGDLPARYGYQAESTG